MFQFPFQTNKQTNKTKQNKTKKKKKKALFQLLHISQLLHLYIGVYIYWVQVTFGVTLNNVTPLNIF